MDLRKMAAAQGLTLNDANAILSMIPWPISYDRGDEGELYAIIHLPRNDQVSAFLLDREGANLVLTDNLSDPLRVVVTAYCDVESAIAHISGVLSPEWRSLAEQDDKLRPRSGPGNRPIPA